MGEIFSIFKSQIYVYISIDGPKNNFGGMFIPELIVLLPTKNEEVGVVEVIDRIPVKKIQSKGFECRIVVVDGNSSDSTCKVAKSKGAEIIISPIDI